MNKQQEKLKELFGEMSDFSDEETIASRDRPPTPGRKKRTVPRVGTWVQRGDRESAQRAAVMASPPPPPPTRRRNGGPTPPAEEDVGVANLEGPTSPPPPGDPITDAAAGTDAQTPDAAAAGVWRTPCPMDIEPPAGPPPVRVILPTGRAIDVPYFAVRRSRKYKLRLGGDRWVMRFDRHGRVTVCRRA